MAVDLTGINNENEFYTNHYLSAIFENDIKDVLSRWKQGEEDGTRPPYAQIRTICKNYFSFSNSFENEKTLDARLELQREWLQLFLPALGYDLNPQFKTLDAGFDIPILYESKKSNGAPDMWMIEGINLYGEDQDPLSLSFSKEQFQAQEMTKDLEGITLDTVITKFVFGMEEPPRWILVLNNSQVMLLDRSKWNEKRMLRFDIPEILGRKEDSTLKATAALLHRESICPDDRIPLLDTLDEYSHKHAFSVSEDLKYALREAIELIGNEAIYYLQEVRRKGVFSGEEKVDDKELTRECLRYMYRLLFVLYIEARPELGYIPMKSDAYRLGYSFESLRDLEIVKLNNEESKNGYYINESINLLFSLVYNGISGEQQKLKFQKGVGQKLFEIPSLKTHLFDPERTPILNKVKFRNTILHRVIVLMSLSRQGGRNYRIGRISYAQLGINQLGAVYEALLSYQGFFAETDLYEVKKAGESYDELRNAFFVKAEDLEKYTDDEKVYNTDGTLKKYEKGAYIYRLAGRDREKSASYYTPEVLTKCLVKYALKELLKDKTADDILKLTVCEPAMGSAAFLNEAINQLAEAYLERKQRELGERISHDEYTYERQKVKMYLADNNVFGVDLNPVAVELAEVSLWLNTISKENFVPWFGMQLVCGNSLIGARRQVFKKTLLKKENRTDPLWLDEVPERIMPNDKRNVDTVYHFLLPDKGMAYYKDKIIKQLASDGIKKINNWRKSFTRECSKSEINTLQKLSETIDTLWAKHIEQQRDMRERTTDTFPVWRQKQSIEKEDNTETRWKDKLHEQELLSKKVRNSSPYRRLKLAMDYWCSLWYWPIEKADLLPSRDEYFLDLGLILEGNPVDITHDDGEQRLLFPDTIPKQMQLKLVNELGIVDVDKLCSEIDRLVVVKEIVDQYRFLHWELEFADIFEGKGGFDLVLGNPPWIKIEWHEGDILSEVEPLFVIRKFSASAMADLRNETLKNNQYISNYYASFEDANAAQNYLSSYNNYSLMQNSSTNLYKCFITNSLWQGNRQSVMGFITDTGIFDVKKAVSLRAAIIKRLVCHFKFRNELKLFSEVGNQKKFEINILTNKNIKDCALYCANLFNPITIDECFINVSDQIPRVRDRKGWVITGNENRLLELNDHCLKIFASFLEGDESQYDITRFPKIHSKSELKVIEKIMLFDSRVRDDNAFFSTVMYDENEAQQEGIIKRKTGFHEGPKIISGPHISNSNLFYQTPKSICKTHRAYDIVDLEYIPDKYFPRTNYVLCNDRKKSVVGVDLYRIAFRRRLNPDQERTFLPCLIAGDVRHIHPVVSCGFPDYKKTLNLLAFSISILADYWVKISSKEDFYGSDIQLFPYIDFFSDNYMWVIHRVLALNCLTDAYKDLCDSFLKKYSKNNFEWLINDKRLFPWSANINKWSMGFPLRNLFSRRVAQIEIDIAVAHKLGLSLSDFLSVFNSTFLLLKQNEEDTWYDQQGRVVFTCSKGLPGVGFSRQEWNEIIDMKDGTVEHNIIDDTLPGGPQKRTIVYHAPFDRCNREKDYEIAWKEFERRFKDNEDNA